MIAIPIIAIEQRESQIALTLAQGGRIFSDPSSHIYAVFEAAPKNACLTRAFEIVCIPPQWIEQKED